MATAVEAAACPPMDGVGHASWPTRRLRAGGFGLVLAQVVAEGSLTAGAEPLVRLDLCEMKPVFMEEFDSMSIASRSLGSARWIAHTPWNGDFGDAGFAEPVAGGPFAVADGVLRITATKGADERWRSGLIAAADAAGHGAAVQEGYFEARMQFPPGPGTWPAFWLSSLKTNGQPPTGIELDVIEYYGHATDKFFSSVHVWSKEAGKSRHTTHETAVPAGSLTAGFHSYGARVTVDTVTFYRDREPFWQAATPPELQTPLFPLVNLALGSGFSIADTPNPSVLLVDYVHVYALDRAGRSDRCPAKAGDEPTVKPAP